MKKYTIYRKDEGEEWSIYCFVECPSVHQIRLIVMGLAECTAYKWKFENGHEITDKTRLF
jgi:hypothetical protein